MEHSNDKLINSHKLPKGNTAFGHIGKTDFNQFAGS